MKLLKTDGIIIRKIDHSEADRFLTLFTKYYGKINININGIRKSKKRHINGTDFFSVSNFIFYKKDEYYTLSSFELTDTFYNIRQDFKKLNISFYILNILNSILTENETRLNLYKLVINSFNFLESNDSILKDYLLLSYFLILLTKEEGIIFSIEDGLYFDIENSIISDKVTPYKFTELEKLIIINLFNKKINAIVDLQPSLIQIEKIISFLETYINYHLNLKINFRDIF